MNSHTWPMVPVCFDGMSNTKTVDGVYQIRGGQDQFARIAESRGLGAGMDQHFVVHAYGNNLSLGRTTDEIIESFKRSGAKVLQLVDGIEHQAYWPELIESLPPGTLFHTTLDCSEILFDWDSIHAISRPNCLYAVNIRCCYRKFPCREATFWSNLTRLQFNFTPFYIMFSGCSKAAHNHFWQEFTWRYRDQACADRCKAESFDAEYGSEESEQRCRGTCPASFGSRSLRSLTEQA